MARGGLGQGSAPAVASPNRAERVIEGGAIHGGVGLSGQRGVVQGARVAVYGIPLDSATTETKGTVLLKSARGHRRGKYGRFLYREDAYSAVVFGRFRIPSPRCSEDSAQDRSPALRAACSHSAQDRSPALRAACSHCRRPT